MKNTGRKGAEDSDVWYTPAGSRKLSLQIDSVVNEILKILILHKFTEEELEIILDLVRYRITGTDYIFRRSTRKGEQWYMQEFRVVEVESEGLLDNYAARSLGEYVVERLQSMLLPDGKFKDKTTSWIWSLVKKQRGGGLVKVLVITLILSFLIYGCSVCYTDRGLAVKEDMPSNTKVYLVPLPGTRILMPHFIQTKIK